MTSGTAGKPSQGDKCTIILPITQEKYEQIVQQPAQFRAWINENGRHNSGDETSLPLSLSGGAIEWQTVCRQLARKSTRCNLCRAKGKKATTYPA